MAADHDPHTLFKLWDVLDNVIVTTQGVYQCGFELLGMDSEHMDISIATRAAESLYSGLPHDVPEKTLMQFVVVSNSNYREVFSRFEAVPEPTDPVLAHQRRRRIDFLKQSNLRRYGIYLFVGKMEGFTRQEFDSVNVETHQARVAVAQGLARKIRSFLERTGHIKLKPLNTERLMALFDEALNPQQMPHETEATPPHFERELRSNSTIAELTCSEQLLRTSIDWEIGHMQLGSLFCKILSLKTVPPQTRFTMMESLFHLGFDFRASIVLYKPEQQPFKNYLERRQKIAASMSQRQGAGADTRHRVMRAGELENLVKISEQDVFQGGMQVAIFGASLKELEARVWALTDHMKLYRIFFSEENAAHDREFFKTLPGMATTFDRWFFATGANAVDLMPLFTNAPGDDRPVFLVKNDREELFSFDPMEPARKNWNAVLLGASGAGKSVFMNMLITTAMLSNLTKGRLVVVDFAGEEKSSYLNVVRLFGGRFIPLLSDKLEGVGLNPFPPPRQFYVGPDRIDKVALGFLMVVTNVLLGNTTEDMESRLYDDILRQGIIELYRRRLAANPDDAPLYCDLYETIKGYRGHEDFDAQKVERLTHLLRGLINDPGAQLLNRPTNMYDEGSFVVFDLFGVAALQPHIRQALVFTVCYHIKSLAFDAADFNYKYVVLDEVAQLLKEKAMQDTVEELYRTARKHNTAIWTATQNYADYVSSGVSGTIALNSDTRLFLTLSDANAIQEQVIQDFRLAGREAHLFRKLVTRKGEYSTALLRTTVRDTARDDERPIVAVVKVELSPFDYQLATSDPRDRKRQNQYVEANPGSPLHKVLDYLAYHRPHLLSGEERAP